jgi:SagB-type dehydrogenase family enzyme
MSEPASGTTLQVAPEPGESALGAVRRYHERTKHQLTRYASGPETLDWDAQPSPFRRFEGSEALLLPHLSDATDALGRALGRRANQPPPALPLPFSLASLGALLALSLGVTAWKRQGPDRWAVRANPSSGNLHPIEAYVLLSGGGFAPGVYHYRAEDHALEQRASWDAQATPAGPRVWVALTTVIWREVWKYGERGFRYCQLDTGHALAALRYAATLLGWRAREQRAISSLALRRVLGLDRSEDLTRTRRPDTELEEPELLLELEAAPGEQPLHDDELLRLAAASRFRGRASLIDAHPMYSWPAVHEVTVASRRSDPPLESARAEPQTMLHCESTRSVAALLLARRSAQRFDREFVLERRAFVEILRGVALTAKAPSSLDLALFVHRVEGLSAGVYLLQLASGDPQRRLLERLGRKFRPRQVQELGEVGSLWELATPPGRELARAVRTLHCNQDIASSCCFALGMLVDLERAVQQPSDYRELLREAGSLGHALYLQAEAAGVRGTGIGCFFDDAVADFLTLGDTPVRSIYHFSIGKPLEDPRIETVLATGHHPFE